MVACRQLAEVLAQAIDLKKGGRILSVECGSGEELGVYRDKYRCSCVLEIEVNEQAVRTFAPSASANDPNPAESVLP